MVTAYDIIFFWVSRMIFQGLEFMKESPFKKCLIHGLIRDPQGRKMSKSLGNGVDPIDVIEKYGVDALRYFLTTSTSPGLDTRYSEEKIQASSAYLNKIWNASRYILMNVENKEINYNFDVKELSTVDKYILSKLQNCISNVTLNMEKYDFSNASTHLYNFVYDDFTSWYVELSKVILNGKNENQKANTRGVLLYCLKSILMMIYPYTPFIAEEIYLSLPEHKDSIMLETYPEVNEAYILKEDESLINDLINLIKDVRAFKVENNLQPNANIKLTLKTKNCNLDELLPYIKRFTFAENISLSNQDLLGAKIYLHFDGLIEENISKEELLIKIDKEIANLEKEIKRSESMLNNQNFISKAPEEKINLEKEKYQVYKEKLEAYLSKKESLKKL